VEGSIIEEKSAKSKVHVACGAQKHHSRRAAGASDCNV